MAPTADDPASSPQPTFELKRTCPACGEKFPADRNVCPECRTNYREARGLDEPAPVGYDHFWPEKAALNWGLWGGVLLIGVAVVWFVAGWRAGYIYFYPPILAVIGVMGIIKGVWDRKEKARDRARREARSRRPRAARRR